MRQRLEDTDYPIVEELGAGDFLFIDSSHAVRFGNDVFYEYLHIIPFLKPGVIVHVHDIFLPHQYPKNWFSDAKYFWAEQYLLLAFLMFNNEFEVLLPMHHLWDQKRLETIFPPHEESPGGFWMRRICPVGN